VTAAEPPTQDDAATADDDVIDADFKPAP
jgi:hypothetical protein